MQDMRTNWMAIWSLILSILSILCCCLWWGSLIIGAAAVIMGIVGYRSDNPNQKDAAIAGIVIGGVGMVLAVSIAIFMILFYAGQARESLGAIESFGSMI